MSFDRPHLCANKNKHPPFSPLEIHQGLTALTVDTVLLKVNNSKGV